MSSKSSKSSSKSSKERKCIRWLENAGLAIGRAMGQSADARCDACFLVDYGEAVCKLTDRPKIISGLGTARVSTFAEAAEADRGFEALIQDENFTPATRSERTDYRIMRPTLVTGLHDLRKAVGASTEAWAAAAAAAATSCGGDPVACARHVYDACGGRLRILRCSFAGQTLAAFMRALECDKPAPPSIHTVSLMGQVGQQVLKLDYRAQAEDGIVQAAMQVFSAAVTKAQQWAPTMARQAASLKALGRNVVAAADALDTPRVREVAVKLNAVIERLARTQCGSCGRNEGTKLRVCARCHGTAYCSEACQRSAWPQHKSVCFRR